MRSTLLLLALASATLSAQKAPLKEVIVVYKTHFDIGYTDLAANVVTKYRTTMIDDALAVVDTARKLPPEQQFVWTLPGWPMSQILWPGQDPARKARVLQAFREGRFVTHALPFTTHTESLELEDLVRGLRFSSNLAREAGLPLPRDAKMTDVPSHSWVIPTILANSGVEFLHLGCNAASSSPDVPRLFWWEGPDRSRVLTMYSRGGYGTGLVPPADWPYPVWLALIHTGDNHGPPRPDEIEKLFAEARSKLPGVKVRIGRLSDFRDALMQTSPQIRTIRGDMPDTWIQGIMSQPVATKRARNERPRIAALNSLETLLRAWGADPGPRPDIALAYEKSLLYGEHTWGMDSKKYGERIYGDEWRQAEAAGRFLAMEASWDEHASYTRAVEEITAPGLKRDLSVLAAQVKPAGLRVVVFNPLPWARHGTVEVETAAEGLQDADTRQPVPAQRIGSRLRFIARDVPPLGYKTYIPASPTGAAPEAAPDNVIENDRFRVTLDPQQGAIRSIYDKSTARELVAPGFGQYLHQRFGNNDIDTYTKAYLDLTLSWAKPDMARQHVPLDETTITRATGLALKIDRGPITSTATLTDQGITLEVSLDRDSPYIDLAWTIRDKQPNTAPEAGWLSLPLRSQQPSFRLGRIGGVIDPATDTVNGSNHDIYALNTGLAALDGTQAGALGLGICPIDSPLISLGRPGGYRYTKAYSQPGPAVYVNLFNNLFGVNFAQWIGGSWSSRIRVWPIQQYEAAASVVIPSLEARVPLEAAVFDGPAGTLPLQRAGLELSAAGVLVTSFGPNPDGPGTLLRLWEQTGHDHGVQVTLPTGIRPKTVQPCNLRGVPQGAPISVTEGRFRIALRGNAPVSLLIPD